MERHIKSETYKSRTCLTLLTYEEIMAERNLRHPKMGGMEVRAGSWMTWGKKQ